jgi:ABC-type dipeptide transport system, periplasmic component
MEWPKWPYDLAKARQLMAEAGYPNGFDVDWVTPTPNYYSRGERIVSQLQAIGIRSKLQVMERGVYLKKMQGGMREWPGTQIIFNARASAVPGPTGTTRCSSAAASTRRTSSASRSWTACSASTWLVRPQ